MTQQIIAILIIVFFIGKQTELYRKNLIIKSEYFFWLFFWLFTVLAILMLPKIDQFVASIGFSASGISVLTELAVAILFYFIFRLRLRIAKLEKDITKIIETIAINK